MARTVRSDFEMMKNILNRIAAAVLFMILSPFMLVLCVLIYFFLGPPVFFHQVRIGYREKPFRFCKFRTMTNRRDADGVLLPDERRLTKFGRILRSTSLDELPQLWHVVTGTMSVVGPRPLLPEYLPRYSAHQRRRHEVKPGITGWAQINGRNRLSWEEKLNLDVWYVDHHTFGLDLAILWKTVRKVLQGEGISSTGHATAPEFKGQNNLG
jgi:sugar transferase EpsL